MKLRGVLLITACLQIGCSSLNHKLEKWLGGGENADNAPKAEKVTRFSESPDVSPRVRRQYKRTTKESLANDSALDSKAGSLWVMEGQGAYLFSQNIVRLVGDPLAVQLEGDPRDQLQSKVGVIKKLLARIEEKNKLRLRDPAGGDAKAPAEDDADAPPSKKKDKKGAGAKNANATETAKAEPEAGDFGVKNVPTRIVERTLEGNYRVKGSQPFLIGNREYKIIVTGVVRAEDFNDEGISATKLLDPKFDIVSSRGKGEM